MKGFHCLRRMSIIDRSTRTRGKTFGQGVSTTLCSEPAQPAWTESDLVLSEYLGEWQVELERPMKDVYSGTKGAYFHTAIGPLGMYARNASAYMVKDNQEPGQSMERKLRK